MNRYGKGICESCHFAKNCALHAPEEITWECSEYEPLVVFSGVRNQFLNARHNQDISAQTASICKQCSAQVDCCFYSPEIFIYNCENYQ